MRLARILIGVVSFLLLLSCSQLPSDRNATITMGPTLADLPEATVPELEAPMPTRSVDEVRAAYRDVLAVSDDMRINQQVLMRLADLDMLAAEDDLLAATTAERHFDTVIDVYHALLDTTEQLDIAPLRRQQLQYQLAKAYALDGRVEESVQVLAQVAGAADLDQELVVEAYFRRAEQAFSIGDYAAALADYQQVVDAGSAGNFYNNALYMAGWSQFKRGFYSDALTTFIQLLDVYETETGLNAVKGPAKSFVDDTLRVMSLAFSYLDGGESISATLADVGSRPYEHILYRRLGAFYQEQNRYRDSADTYDAYVLAHPASRYAPDFTIRTIDVLAAGNFPSLVLERKQYYVDTYGVDSEFYRQAGSLQRIGFEPKLAEFLLELGQYHHARAQAVKRPSRANVLYRNAAHRYEQYVRAFPDAENTADIAFLLGEVLAAAGDYELAVERYIQVAYDYPVATPQAAKQAAEAGYAAILNSQNLIQAIAQDEVTTTAWRQRKTALSVRFSDTFPNDERALPVLTAAATEFLTEGSAQAAIDTAFRVVNWQYEPAPDLLKTAWRVIGQGSFDLGFYEQAETGFSNTLVLESVATTKRDIEANLAASVYKQAEQHVALQEYQLAVDDFLRIKQITPAQSLAASGQFDAINYLLELSQWDAANAVIEGFEQDYPRHELLALLPAKKLLIYEQLEQWAEASDILYAMYKTDDEPEVQRTSLYLAAEYSQKAGDTANAIKHYRKYAHSYAEPFEQLLEAQFQMSELYLTTNEPEKRQYWFKKMLNSHEKAAQPTARSRYLAAFSLSGLGDANYQQFLAVKLKLPLKRSLAAKKKAMSESLAYYQQVVDYGVSEFVTKANFRLGEIYLVLSQDLMQSQRPKNLDALALEQYDILLEEQAFPFEEKGIALHQVNSERTAQGFYDQWVKQSFASLATILPARYAKQEQRIEASNVVY